MPERICSDTSFSDFMLSEFGVSITPIMDDRLHRFDIRKRGDKAGWYVYHMNDGRFHVAIGGCWQTGQEFKWYSKKESELTPFDREAIRRADAERVRIDEEEHKRKAEEARKIYEGTAECPDDFPYLLRKGVRNHDGLLHVTEDGSALVVPVLGVDGKVKSVQKIFADPNRHKWFLPGAEKKGGFCCIGNVEDKAYLCEGYATGASIYEATGTPVIIAFDGGNMRAVADELRNRVRLTVVADNDDKSNGKNPGREYAEATGLPYKLIPEPGKDANDYAAEHGLEALRIFLEPKVSEWIERGDDFIRKPTPLRWLIKGWLPEEGLVMVYGASNSGKTFAVLDMLLSMSTGCQEWQGRKAKEASCLYLCGEGKAGLRGRVAVWVQEHKGTSTGRFGVSSGPKQLNEPADLAYVAEQIRLSGLNPDVIAIDTLNRFFSGNENKADEIGGFLGALSSLQTETHALIILIHHTGVSEEAQNRARGSSAIRGAVDIEIHVENENGCITLTQTKQRDAEIQEPIHLRLVSREIDGWFDEDGETVKSAVLEGIDADEKRSIEATEEISVLMSAWLNSDHGIAFGYPAITVEELRAYMRKGLGWSRDRVKKAFASDGRSRFLRKLYLSGMVQAMDDLIVLTDSVYATCCFLTLEGMEKEVVPSGANMVPS